VEAILTKPLVKGEFVFYMNKLGVVRNPFLARGSVEVLGSLRMYST